MAISQRPMSDESIPIEEIGTVPIRHTDGKFRVTVTDAIEAAGGVTGSIVFDVEMIDELGGMVPAILTPDKVDGRQSKMGRAIITEGNAERRAYRVTLPREMLEGLGYDLDRVREAEATETPIGITVYAGPEMLAFERPERRTVQIDRDQFDAEEPRDVDRDRDDTGQFVSEDDDVSTDGGGRSATIHKGTTVRHASHGTGTVTSVGPGVVYVDFDGDGGSLGVDFDDLSCVDGE